MKKKLSSLPFDSLNPTGSTYIILKKREGKRGRKNERERGVGEGKFMNSDREVTTRMQ